MAEELTDAEFDEKIQEAADMGYFAGEHAATWVDVEDDKTAKRILKGLNDGDPEILDSFRLPDLSEESAGDPTPASLMDDLGLEDVEPEEESELCDAYREQVADGFYWKLEDRCRKYLKS